MKLDARWISGHAIEPGWPVQGGAQRVVCADQAEAALRRLADEAETELADLRRSCKEGWRYAAELEEERKLLQAELDRLAR